MSTRAWIYFGIVSVLWGIPYLFIRVAVDDGVPPAFLAWARVVLGALIVLLLAWRAGALGSLRGRWGSLARYAVLEIVIPFPLIAAGERHVSSSIAAILIAAVPLIVALLALRFDASERVHGARLVGLLIGLAGVVALVGVDVAGNSDELLGAGAILLAAVGYAAGPMLLKQRLADLDPRALMGGALAAAAVLLTPLAVADLPGEVPSGDAITYVAPVVAVAAGVVVLDERPGAGSVAGLLLIIAGSWLATGGGPPWRRGQALAAASSADMRSRSNLESASEIVRS
jgi:drug/metabolite transporter (DMT)-like permease